MASGRVNNPEGKWILCQDCTGTQRTEMECCICGQWKGLDGFAKAQRKNSENAVGNQKTMTLFFCTSRLIVILAVL